LNVGNNTALGTGPLTFQTSANNVLQSGAPDLIIGNGISLTLNGIVDTNGNTMTLAGLITGSGLLTKQGAGTLVLSQANSYGGGTNLAQGTLNVQDSAALGAGNLTFLTNANNVLQSGAAGLNLANAILFSQNAVVDSNGNTFTLSGAISGPGALTTQGSGIVVLSGSNTYAGGTTINAGTLEIDTPASIPTGGAVAIAASGAQLDLSSAGGAVQIGDLSSVAGGLVTLGANNLTFGTANDTSFAGAISGSGVLTKQGSGTLEVDGANPFTGTFNITAGTVDTASTGSFSAASTINVAPGAALSGTGTLGTVNLSGDIAPGHSIGTLNVGNITFNTGSNFLLELSDTASDMIVSSGVVTIDPGATITLFGTGLIMPASSYPIITAASPLVLNGEFALVNPFPRFTFVLQYRPNEVLLTLGSVINFFAKGNAAGVAECFNTLLSDPDPIVQDLINILDLQPMSDWQNTFEQMQPANFNNIAFAQENVAERIRQNYTAHLFQQRVEGCPDSHSWRLWAAPFIEHVHQRGKGELKGYKEHFAGFTTALDYQPHKHWALTGGFSYAKSHLGVVHGKASGEFKTYAGTLGAIWAGPHLFIDALASYLFSDIQAKRKMSFSAPGTDSLNLKAHHSQNSNQAMGHLGTGYNFKIKQNQKTSWDIYPFVDVDYIYVHQQGYKEQGAKGLDLKVKEKDYDLLRPEGGIGFAYAQCFKRVDLTLDVSASYIREQRFLGRATKAQFRDSTCQFSVNGLKPKNNLFSPTVRFTLDAQRSVGFILAVEYHGEYGSHFVENAGEVELKASF
jgi:autotransporter-associated beta strand protein